MRVSCYRWLSFVFFQFCILSHSPAQTIRIDEESPKRQFPDISMVYDRIFNSSSLDSFYEKLKSLKQTGKGRVSIVHIGDSHVQSKFYPDVVKKNLQEFFGGADSAGISYHVLGQNGARFETFNKSATFWAKLRSLQADLYIISLGTNDAQGYTFNEKAFIGQVRFMLDSLAKLSPGIPVLFTTAADSFKNRFPNRLMWNMNISLYTFCVSNKIAIWDLYRTTNGYGSAYNWIKRGMMDNDGIHYTAKAYQLQGQLLFNAIGRGYNAYVNDYR